MFRFRFLHGSAACLDAVQKRGRRRFSERVCQDRERAFRRLPQRLHLRRAAGQDNGVDRIVLGGLQPQQYVGRVQQQFRFRTAIHVFLPQDRTLHLRIKRAAEQYNVHARALAAAA